MPEMKLSDGREHARTLDAEDPLAELRERFCLPEKAGEPAVYLCGNSLGLMPKEARTLVDEELEDWARLAVDGHFEGRRPWYAYHEPFEEPLARVVGARPSEVVCMNGLTVNLHLLMASFYRPTKARYRIAIEQSAFPSDRYAVQSQARFHGFDPKDAVVVLKPREGEHLLRTEDVQRYFAEEGESVALLLLGGVNFLTGQRYELGPIAKAARAAGVVVGYDLAHAAGNVPLSLHEWDVDFAAWCSYKYLNAGPGATAGAFVHERHGNDPTLPRFAGWWGTDPKTRFEMTEDFVPQPGAAGWQLSNAPVLSMAPLLASLRLFDEAGMAALRKKSEALTAFLLALLEDVPAEKATLLTPADPAHRGSQLSLKVRGDARVLQQALERHGVVCDVRPPDVIRVAPVPLYNSFADVAGFARALAACLG